MLELVIFPDVWFEDQWHGKPLGIVMATQPTENTASSMIDLAAVIETTSVHLSMTRNGWLCAQGIARL